MMIAFKAHKFRAYFFTCLIVLCGSSVWAMELHVCTYANASRLGLNCLAASCEENGIDLKICGIGSVDDQGHPLPFPDYMEKVRVTYDWLKNADIPDDDVVMFLDAYDVIVLSDKETILDRFMQFGKPVVIGAERGCFHLPHVVALYPPSPTSFRFVNSGCYLGYVKNIRRILAWILNHQELAGLHKFDQTSFTIYFLRNQQEVALDYFNYIVINGYQLKRDEITVDMERKKVVFNRSGVETCAFHGNVDKEIYEEIRSLFYGM